MFLFNQTFINQNQGRKRSGRPYGRQWAFTRLDLAAAIAVILLLVTIFGSLCFGERGRTAKCQANLKALGNAMQDFASEHSDALPPAIIDTRRMVWDAQIVSYLPYRLVKGGIDPVFKCPSDALPHARARSYAMSGHDMLNENWPPGPDNATGVGLVWNQENISRLLGERAAKAAMTNADMLAMMKLSFIPSPAETMLLTEVINSGNNLKENRWAAIENPGQQLEQLLHDNTSVHHGRYNYLMMDGHVELMSPLQAGDTYGNMKMWRIRRSD